MRELKLFIHDLWVRINEQKHREATSQAHAFNNGAIRAIEKINEFIDNNYLKEGIGEAMQTQRVLTLTIERQLHKLKRIIGLHTENEEDKQVLEEWVQEIIDSTKLLLDTIEADRMEAELDEKGKKASRKLNIEEVE